MQKYLKTEMFLYKTSIKNKYDLIKINREY